MKPCAVVEPLDKSGRSNEALASFRIQTVFVDLPMAGPRELNDGRGRIEPMLR